ncbi:hypothetical protein GCM10020331_026520 [Ectobacillus funiculus]
MEARETLEPKKIAELASQRATEEKHRKDGTGLIENGRKKLKQPDEMVEADSSFSFSFSGSYAKTLCLSR